MAKFVDNSVTAYSTCRWRITATDSHGNSSSAETGDLQMYPILIYGDIVSVDTSHNGTNNERSIVLRVVNNHYGKSYARFYVDIEASGAIVYGGTMLENIDVTVTGEVPPGQQTLRLYVGNDPASDGYKLVDTFTGTFAGASVGYQSSAMLSLADELSRPADFVIQTDADWDQVNNSAYQTIEVAPGDYSGKSITFNFSGTAGNRKVIRAQNRGPAVSGQVGYHPYHTAPADRVIMPIVDGYNSVVNHAVISGMEITGNNSLVFGEGAALGAANTDVVLDRLWVHDCAAGKGSVGFYKQASGCHIQNVLFQDNSTAAESVSIFLGGHLGGEVFADCTVCNIEAHDCNDLIQFTQVNGGENDYRGFYGNNLWAHYDPAKRLDANGNVVGAVGIYGTQEAQLADFKSFSLDAAKPMVLEDIGIIGARNAYESAQGIDLQSSGITHSDGTATNLTIRRYTAIDCNYNVVFARTTTGSNCTFEDFTAYQCGEFVTVNGNYLDDYDGVFIFKNFDASCALSNVRNLDAVTSMWIEIANFAGTQTGVYSGTSAAASGSDRVIYPWPITNAAGSMTVPKGNAA